MDPGVAAAYNLQFGTLDELERLIVDSYDPDRWGVVNFEAIEDVVARSVASDLLVSLMDGMRSALLDLWIASDAYEGILGPNGRTMPGPETTIEQRVELAVMDGRLTECFRAFGTIWDCLAALTVLVLGIPLKAQRAEGGWLLHRPHGRSGPEPQEAIWSAVSGLVIEQGSLPEPGWMAWALETRNAVVHRGSLLRTWLNRPSSLPPQRLHIRTETPVHYLIRMEEHLRRKPWLPDMHAMSTGHDQDDLWLEEPAQITLRHLRERTLAISLEVSRVLIEAWQGPMAGFSWPVADWDLQARESGRRIELADNFRGFDVNYGAPRPTSIRMHGDSAKRAVLAERLRTRDRP